MDEQGLRKIGVSHGMVHALAMLKRDIGQRCCRPIPPNHTRRLREREMQIAPLREIYARLEVDLRALQANIAAEH